MLQLCQVEGKALVLGLKSRIPWVVNTEFTKPYTESSLFGLNDVLGASNSPPLILPLPGEIPCGSHLSCCFQHVWIISHSPSPPPNEVGGPTQLRARIWTFVDSLSSPNDTLISPTSSPSSLPNFITLFPFTGIAQSGQEEPIMVLFKLSQLKANQSQEIGCFSTRTMVGFLQTLVG